MARIRRRRGERTARSRGRCPPGKEVHVHFHGVTDEDLTAILAM